MSNSGQGPLVGLKVLDLSQIMAGPYCTMVLADLGAEVIKVEKPEVGDDSREMGPYINGESSCFAQINRNKKGLVLNLKNQKARDILYKMVAWADVFIENYRVGVTASLGIDYATLKEINPGLVYCSVSGYGQTGPYADKGGFDLVIQGLTGMMSMTGEPEGRPLKSSIAVYDVGAGLTATYAILAAMIHRKNTGEGQYIDISLAECGLPWFVWEAAAYFAAGVTPNRTGSRHRVSAPYQAIRARDGFFVIGAANQRTWERLCRDVLQRPELIDDPRFISNSDRHDNIEELERVLESHFMENDVSDWLQCCGEAGVPCGPINNFDQALRDSHFIERGMIQELEHPKLGRMKTIAPPTHFSATPASVRTAAPLLGEHTDEILHRFGYGADEILEFKEQGVIQQSVPEQCIRGKHEQTDIA